MQKVNIEKELLLRFLVMGRKSLPDPKEKSRPYWGFVEMVTGKAEDVKAAFAGGIDSAILCSHFSLICIRSLVNQNRMLPCRGI